MNANDTLYTLVYGEIYFDDRTARIDRIVGFMEIPPLDADARIDMVDEWGYDYICLQQAKHISVIQYLGAYMSKEDFYKAICSKL